MFRFTTPRTRRAGRGVAVLGSAAFAAAALTVASFPGTAVADPGDDKLGAHDRALIEQYAAERSAQDRARSGDETVPDFATLMLATGTGDAEAVAEAVTALGAEVTRVEPAFGYVKANVPFDAVEAVAAIEDVELIDVDELLALEDTRADGELTAAGDAPATSGRVEEGPTGKTRVKNDFMPTDETGSVDFVKKHPEADGRGVTVGIMDTGVDPTHPALATTTTGEKKLVDTVTGTDPMNFIDLIFDDSWHLHSTAATVEGPEFTDLISGTQWTGPAESGLRVSYEPQEIPGLETVNVGVLSRDSDETVWVDTDFDHDFTDETPLRPYAEDGSIGVLGVDDPATPISEAVPFTVQTRPLAGSLRGVNLNVITAAHGTHVAGIVAGNSFFGGSINGQAPGAKLVSMRACHTGGCSSAALTDGMIDLAANYGVDVINMSIGGSPALNDGKSARELIYDRVIAETGVQMLISAGNSGTGTNTHGNPAGAASVLSVGAAVSKDTYRANYGAKVTKSMDVFPFSSRGPLEDGGFKPDIVAPGSAISSTPAWIVPTGAKEAGYVLEPGYSMMNGTSMASPQAAGAAALLLSAADEAGINLDPVTLRTALTSTADLIHDVPAIAQGHGLIDVPAAWKLIEKGNASAYTVLSSAPVCTVLTGDFEEPGQGRGVFNNCAPAAGGQSVGESREYTVTLTRTTGPRAAQKANLRIIGGDGTFKAPTSVKLARDEPTEVKITSKPRKPGMHSAELRVDDTKTKAIDASVMLAVTAAEELVPGETWHAKGSVDRNGTAVYTVAVPEGAGALTVSMPEFAAGEQVRWWAFTPEGLSAEVPDQGSVSCYQHYQDGYDCAPYERTYENPAPGVWELVVEARRTTEPLKNKFELSATVQ